MLQKYVQLTMHTLSTTMLHTEQKWDITCKNLVSQLCYSNKGNFKSVITSANGILQKQQFICGFKDDVIRAPSSFIPTSLHDFHDSKGHEGTIHVFKAIKRSYWCPKLWQDIVKYINNAVYVLTSYQTKQDILKTSRNTTNTNGSFSTRYHRSLTNHIQRKADGLVYIHPICSLFQ